MSIDHQGQEDWVSEQRLLRRAPRIPTPAFSQRLEDRQFLEMEQAFRASGGIVSGDEVARRMRRRSDQPISTLARWIVERQAVSFQWKTQIMLPLFQFDMSSMVLRQPVVQVVDEFRDVFDDWDLALWFARPNSWLSESAPVDVIELDAAAVLDAARADRFVALG